MAILKREGDEYALERTYIMSCDFSCPTACDLGAAFEFVSGWRMPKMEIVDLGDGGDIELKQHEIIEMIIYISIRKGEQIYIKQIHDGEEVWVPVMIRPTFLSRNLSIFVPFNRGKQSTF